MLKTLKSFKASEGVPRILVDLITVHIAMISSLAVSVAYHAMTADAYTAHWFERASIRYYLMVFLPLSLLFPVCYFVCGFYTDTRNMNPRKKRMLVARGGIISIGIFLGATFLLLGNHQIGRSIVIPFCILLAAGLVLTRVIKAQFELRYHVTPRVQQVLAMEQDRPVLVFGGAGYIGSLLVKRLLDMGRRVRVLDVLMYGDQPIREFADHPNLELINGDCRNIQDVIKAMRGAGPIVHLAAIVGDPACEQDRETALQVNYAATRMLIQVAKGQGISRFVFASSCSVYGASDVEVDEGSTAKPISLYGQTKVDSETALLEAADTAFHPVILRFATVFGLGFRPRFDLVVNLLSAKAFQEGIITIYNGEQWRPFIHVRDLVEGIVLSLNAPLHKVSSQVFNIGDSRLNHTLGDVAAKIQAQFPNTRVDHVENADRRNYRVNFDKARKTLGFEARHTLDDGILEFKKAFEQGLICDYKDIHYHNQRFIQASGSPANKHELDAYIMNAFATSSGLPKVNGPVGVMQ